MFVLSIVGVRVGRRSGAEVWVRNAVVTESRNDSNGDLGGTSAMRLGEASNYKVRVPATTQPTNPLNMVRTLILRRTNIVIVV